MSLIPFGFLKSRTSSIVTTDLRMYLDAGNASSYPGTGTTWTDLSGFGNNATLSGGVGYISTFGGALVFDGVDNRGDVTNASSLNFTNVITISAWFRYSGGITNEMALVRKELQWQLGFQTTNTIRCLIGTSGTTGWTGANDVNYTFTIGDWYNIAMTYDGSNMRIYVNNSLVKTATVTGAIVPTTDNVKIGYQTAYLNGNIGHILIYNKALNATEIEQNWNALKSRYGYGVITSMPTEGLVLHLDAGNTASYPGSGTTWTNLANSNFTTTLVPWNSGSPIAYNSANGGSLLFAGASAFERDRADVTTTLTHRQTWNSYWANSTEMTCIVIMKAKFTGSVSIRDSIIGQRYFFGIGFGYHIHGNSNFTRSTPAITMPYSESANNFNLLGDSFNSVPTDGMPWENFDNAVIFTGFTHNGSTRDVKYWLNNTFGTTSVPQFTPANTYMTDTTNNVQIGVFTDAGGWRDKSIYQIAIWNRVLTNSEITGVYNAYKSRHGYS